MSLAVNNQHMNSTETLRYDYYKSRNDMNKKFNRQLAESTLKLNSPKEISDDLKKIVDEFKTEWEFAYYISNVSERSSDIMNEFHIKQGSLENLPNGIFELIYAILDNRNITNIIYIAEDNRVLIIVGDKSYEEVMKIREKHVDCIEKFDRFDCLILNRGQIIDDISSKITLELVREV